MTATKQPQAKPLDLAQPMFHITMDKSRSTWTYFTSNKVGGGFGSNYCGPQSIALMRARANIKSGQQYRLTINGKDRGIQVKP